MVGPGIVVVLNRVESIGAEIQTYELSQGGSVIVWWGLQGDVQLSDRNLEDLRHTLGLDFFFFFFLGGGGGSLILEVTFYRNFVLDFILCRIVLQVALYSKCHHQ